MTDTSGSIGFMVLRHHDRIEVLRHIKNVAGSLAAPLILGGLRKTHRRAGLVLLYHVIGETDGDPKSELVPAIGRAAFAKQLEYLRRQYEIVDLKDLGRAASNRRRGGRFPVAITFDDDLPNHVTCALPELGVVGASATFFLCGSFLDDRSSYFWWQRLQRAGDAGCDLAPVRALLQPGANDGDIHDLAAEIESLPPDRRDEVEAVLEALAGEPADHETLSIRLAQQLVTAGASVGFHTRRHDALPQLTDAQLKQALAEGREALERFAGQRVDVIAYPHGAVNERVASAASRAGFKIGVTCEETALTPRTDALLIGRCEPRPGLSLGQFTLHLVRLLAAARD